MIELIKTELEKLPEADRRAVLREILQYIILSILYKTDLGKQLGFMGGTSLHIFFQTKRFSEDLDFNLLGKLPYPFHELLEIVHKELTLLGLESEYTVNTNTNVYKSFIKFPSLIHGLGFVAHKDEKVQIKLEIDIKPPKLYVYETDLMQGYGQESYVQRADLASMFAAKLYVCFHREYVKGRDFFDVLWFLQKNIVPYYPLMKELGLDIQSKSQVVDYFTKGLKKIDFALVKKDILPLLQGGDGMSVPEKDVFLTVLERWGKL